VVAVANLANMLHLTPCPAPQPDVPCPCPTGSLETDTDAAMRILGGLLQGSLYESSTSVEPKSPDKVLDSAFPCATQRPRVLGPTRADQQDEAATNRILGLLQGITEVTTDSKTAKATPLEYRGQWQPKPNGAETGHGVVPQDWALELANENDRQLASYSWAGGAQLCLSNAFRQSMQMETQAQDLIDSGTCAEDDAAVQCIRTIAKAVEEREAVMRRQWCDIEFQEGEEANSELLRCLERDFAGQLVEIASKQAKHGQINAHENGGLSGMSGSKGDAGSVTGCKWYHLKVSSGTKAGRVYLSATIGGEGVDLYGHDDESGRQRWLLEPGGIPSGNWFHLRLFGGTTLGRRLLNRGVGGRLELCEHDDGSGRQRWLLEICGNDQRRWISIRPATAAGNPGLGAAAAIEAHSRGKCLGATDTSGTHVTLCETDDGSGRQRWLVPGWLEPWNELPHTAVTEPNDDDAVLTIARHSGSETVVSSLRGLTQEQMVQVLGHNRSLGTAIDLVGCYLKNYEIDKADRLCSRIEPLCRERGGMWLFKLLNFYTTVRMKQSRYVEALKMYTEYETLIGFKPDEAWELYDTVYRNFGWIHTSLHNYSEALEYFEKCVEVKRHHGVPPHWFDQWDLGKTHARQSLQRNRPKNLELALQLIEEGIELHKQAEPTDFIMRCKMLNSAGECACILGDFTDEGHSVAAHAWYDRGIALHEESHALYLKVLGPTKPLTGWAMEDLAGAYRRRCRDCDAKPLLKAALHVECTKDIIKLSSMVRLLDSVLEVHRSTGDRSGLADCQDTINAGLDNLRRRGVDVVEAVSYAALLQKIVEVLLEHDEVANCSIAVTLLGEGLGYLQRQCGTRCATNSVESQEGHEEASWQQCEWQFNVPRAGQQELEINASTLQLDMEQQLVRLTDLQSMEVESELAKATTEAAAEAAAASAGTEGSKLPDLSTSAQKESSSNDVFATTAGQTASARHWPLHFETIDDDVSCGEPDVISGGTFTTVD